MSEVPDFCTGCAITFPAYCNATELTDPYRGEYEPTDRCPLVRLDQLDMLEKRVAEIERLRAFVDEIADSPCTAPMAGYAEGHGETLCYLECATCRARVYNVEFPRQALEGGA